MPTTVQEICFNIHLLIYHLTVVFNEIMRSVASERGFQKMYRYFHALNHTFSPAYDELDLVKIRSRNFGTSTVKR